MLKNEMEEKIEQLHEKIHYLNKKLIAQEEELEKITQAYNYALEKCNENAKTIKKAFEHIGCPAPGQAKEEIK